MGVTFTGSSLIKMFPRIALFGSIIPVTVAGLLVVFGTGTGSYFNVLALYRFSPNSTLETGRT